MYNKKFIDLNRALEHIRNVEKFSESVKEELYDLEDSEEWEKIRESMERFKVRLINKLNSEEMKI